MSIKNDLSRITVDISAESHKKLKALAAFQGKSMRSIIVDLIDQNLVEKNIVEECPYSHIPNEKTIQAIKRSENEKNLVKIKNVRELLKKV